MYKYGIKQCSFLKATSKSEIEFNTKNKMRVHTHTHIHTPIRISGHNIGASDSRHAVSMARAPHGAAEDCGAFGVAVGQGLVTREKHWLVCSWIPTVLVRLKRRAGGM